MKNTKLECKLIKEEKTEDDKINILQDIKSKYVLIDILSFINNKEKLKLINYNKQSQKIIGVDINDYKNRI